MKRGAIYITLSYLIISSAWIYFSGELLHFLFRGNQEMARSAEFYKGFGFVLITSFLLYQLIRHYYNRLEKSNHQYKDMFESNPNAMWVYDRKTFKFLRVNRAAVLKYGYSENEFLSMDIFDIRSPEEGSRLRAYLADRDSDKKIFSGIWLHTVKDGSVITAKIVSHDIVYNNRKGKLVLALDISKREAYELKLESQQKNLQRVNKELELNIKKLEKSQRELRNTQKIARIAGWTFDVENRIFNFDDEAQSLVNIPRNATLDMLNEIIHPSDIEQLNDFITTFNEDTKKGQCIVKVRSENNWIFVRFQAYLTVNTDGNKMLEGFIQDIDLLTKIGIENKKMDKIISHIKNLVVITNHRGEIEWANKAYSDAIGYTLKESIGKRPWDFIKTTEESQASLNKMIKAIQEKTDFSVEITNLSKEGNIVWLQIDGSPIYDDHGNHIGYIAIESEITERKQKELQIEEQNNLLYQAAWFNSHQVRKPLASILGLIELLRLAKTQEEALEYLNLLEICGNELDETIKTSVNLADNYYKDKPKI